VILLDLLMPDMDGWQFRAEQLTDHSLSAIPVIAMTGRRGCPGISVQAQLQKPFSGQELLSTVARLAMTPLSSGGDQTTAPSRARSPGGGGAGGSASPGSAG
jgi:CheY-like chemotaxis protein